MSARPPRALSVLARLLVRGRHREFVLGDLDELYARRVGSHRPLRAAWAYVRDVLASVWARRDRPERRRKVRRTRPQRGLDPGDLIGDLRHAVRACRRRPGFTLLLVATVALGMGPTIAVLSMVEQLLLRPLPGASNSDAAAYLRLLESDSEMAEFSPEGLTLHEFDELRRRATLVDALASYGYTSQQVSVDGARPVLVGANTFYGDFFEALGVRPAEGRLIPGAETALDADPLVAVISEDLRTRLFGPEAEAVGRAVLMNGQPVEIVGVAGGGFRGPVRGDPTDAWLPHGALVPLVGFTRERLESPQSVMHSRILALPAAGATLAGVEQQVSEIFLRLGEANPERAEELARVQPSAVPGLHMPPAARERAYRTLSMMGWATALLLMIACANVADLLLFENMARRGGMATLRALGASTGRIARQHLVRSLLIAGLGASVGAALGWGIGALFRGPLLLGLPSFEGLHPDLRLSAFVAGALVTTTIVFGVGPALLAGRFDLGDALRLSAGRDTGRFASLRIALCGGQIALTLGLLVGGILMFRTIVNIQGIDTGIEIERVVGVTFDAPEDLEPASMHALQRGVLDAVASQPGVERATLDWYGPHGSQFVAPVGLPTDAENYANLPRMLIWQVSPGWFELFGLEAASGRTFDDGDWRVPSSGAAILTESTAQRIFGRADVVGQVVWIRGATPPERRVVGVVEDYTSLVSVRATDLEGAFRPAEPTDAVFLPYGDFLLRQITVFAKMTPPAPEVPRTVQGVIESLFPDVPSPQPYLLQDRVDRIHREERLLGRLLLTLAVFGALMSGVGLFAAIYFMVASRKRELGIRVALGADAVRILKLVTRSAAAIVVGGVAAGLLIAYPLTSALRSRLYGIEHLDPVSYGTAALALGLVAFLACIAPAREALRADPVAVLREE